MSTGPNGQIGRPSRGNGRINFRVRVTNIKALAQGNKELERRLRDWRPLWPKLVPVMIAGVKEMIDSKGAATGHRWPGPHRRYLRRKVRSGHGTRELMYSGRLMRQILSPAGIIQRSASRMMFGSKLPGARAAQFGRGYWFIDWTAKMKEATLRETREFMARLVEQVNAWKRENG